MPRQALYDTTATRFSLDVRELARSGYLAPGAWVRRASSGGVVVMVTADEQGVRLSFGYDGRPREQRLSLDQTDCELGGARPWWLCPACGRRCAIVYFSRGEFACRLCSDLRYESQRRHGLEVLIDRARRIRQKVRGSPDLTLPFPERPPGMHRATYERLRAEGEQAEAAVAAAQGAAPAPRG
jgi:hypothetical protein